MKKLLFVFAAIVAICFASCNNRTCSNLTEEDTVSVDTLVDTLVIDSVE